MEAAFSSPIFVRGTFIIGLILLVIGLARRDILLPDTGYPLWIFGGIILLSGPMLRFISSSEQTVDSAIVDLGARVLIGIISSLIVYFIVNAIKR